MANVDILVAEDDAVLRTLYQKKFSVSGYETRIAADGEEAIKMIGSEKQDLITLDGNLAENGHGINVLKKIDGENWKKTIIISSDEFFLKFCKVNHILALDKKDLSEETLLPLIKKILGLE